MTDCPRGDHAFPYEDNTGAYCEEHGITLLWHGEPITPDDLDARHEERPAVQESADPRYAELVATWNRTQTPSRDAIRPVRGFVAPSAKH
ncbi:hypothetical protein [Streptomyces sp. A 4/2]|uniref:hypothetical protein n=1 Tax=Streptomyces sp. A 4/2 TaxID=2934314 RepID=UPI0020258BFD|nr:hypothetical protein [Streptomyces sp. A 4/2]